MKAQKTDKDVVDLCIAFAFDTQGIDLAVQIVSFCPYVVGKSAILSAKAERKSLDKGVVDAVEKRLQVLIVRGHHLSPLVLVVNADISVKVMVLQTLMLREYNELKTELVLSYLLTMKKPDYVSGV